MAKVTADYELLYIIDTDLSEEDTAALVEKFQKLIGEYGSITETALWGKRKLAYPINDKPEGYYVLEKFNAKPDCPAELDRVLGITEGIVRSMITAVEE